MVQRRAARFATSIYSREPGTVTNILNTLGWPSLQSRRKTSRLTLLYKATHDKAAINIPSYIRRPSISTRQYYPYKFSQISTSTDAYKFSFLPRTITDWNSLPPEAYPGYHARELQGDHPETAYVNSEPSVFIRILLAFANTEHPR